MNIYLHNNKALNQLKIMLLKKILSICLTLNIITRFVSVFCFSSAFERWGTEVEEWKLFVAWFYVCTCPNSTSSLAIGFLRTTQRSIFFWTWSSWLLTSVTKNVGSLRTWQWFRRFLWFLNYLYCFQYPNMFEYMHQNLYLIYIPHFLQ